MQENNLYQCQLCNFKTNRVSSLIVHVHYKHNISSEQYYIKYGVTGKKDNKCIICGKPTRYINFSQGYRMTCGYKCGKVYSEKDCLEKYGVKNVSQNKQVQIRRKTTFLNKYGVEHPLQNKQVQNKCKRTCFNRYGAEYPLQNKEIQEKFKQTCFNKYGVEHPMQNEQIQAKSKATCFNKYGFEYSFQNKQVQTKFKKTCIKRYGFENPSKNIQIKNKKKITCFKNYGVEHPLQNKQIFNKVMENFNKTIRLKEYNYNDHIIHYQTKPQLQFIKLCQQLNYQVYDCPGIKYQFEEKEHITYPDFLLQYPNNKKRIVQIKGDHKFYRQQVASGKFEVKCNAIKQYSKQNKYLDFIVVMHV